MPSKYTGWIHASQDDMDKLVKIDPEINTIDGDFPAVLKHIWKKLISGGYSNAQFEKPSVKLKDEKTEQEIIQLKIRNRIAIIHDLQLAPQKAVDVVEKKIPIEAVIGNLHESPVQNINEISPYDEPNKRFECNECGVLFAFEKMELSEMQKAQTNYLEHIFEKHNRKLTPIEIDMFKKLGIPV